MSAALGFDAERLKRIDAWMAANRTGGRYTGSSVLLARHGEVAYCSCDGLRSVAKNLPYERDTIVRIYSMTKVVTSVVFGMLLERGEVYLDTPVSAYLPEFGDMKALIPGAKKADQVEPAPSPTLQQLLTHTSGMTYGFNPGLAAQIYAKARVDFGPRSGALQDRSQYAASQPLAFQPGTRWEYSVGIDIIGRVIEVITGQTLDQVFRERVFEPLGMDDTFFGVPQDKISRFADCYTKTEDDACALLETAEESAFRQEKVSCFSGGGGLCSTLDDYMRFGEMIRRGGTHGKERLIGARTLAFMRQNHLPGDIASMGAETFSEMPMSGMGFGIGGGVVLSPSLTRSAGSVGDFGWGGMASTYFWTDPVEDLTAVYFTQLVPSSSYPSRAELKALVHGALID
ncbi:beta-lactamase family protein [Rhodobacteraceae bacterium D3-12]|nr:beta-lactamase family protein [Rhodobacteraceae bacterium D3-12]